MDLQRGLYDGEMCLADNATTHIIFRNKEYFMSLTLIEDKVNIISSLVDLIEGSRRAMCILANGIELCIITLCIQPSLEEIFSTSKIFIVML